MRIDCITTSVGCLSSLDAQWIVRHMTRSGSEFQREVDGRAGDTPVALIRNKELRIACWVATHEWQGKQTIEGFTCEQVRRRGMARAAAALLVAAGFLRTDRPTAVFSPDCVEIAKSIGCRNVSLYERSADGQWVVV